MELPGSLDVNERGGASYDTPIAVPPGTAGMVPALTLSYNSLEGSGLVGVGWSLTGLPAIGRCPQTVAQDGVKGSINFDANDRFCLDGHRLVAVSGTYGANGTEYRTELEGFSKIISNGTSGTGPTWFEVRTKSGQRMVFGNTADSRIVVQGSQTVRAWALNRVEDTKGNYLTITYTSDLPNGQAYPARIDYTGNVAAGVTPYNSVRFTYEERPDIVPLYLSGALIKTTKRLTNVKTYAGAALVSDYRLAYHISPATRHSRLGSVQLCNAGNVCLPGPSFGYTGVNFANGNGFTINTNPAGQNGTLSGYMPWLADFNGDGRDDIFWDKTDGEGRSQNLRALWLSTGNGTFQVISNPTVPASTTNSLRYIGDFNADGKADFLWVPSNSGGGSTGAATLWFSNGDGTFQLSSQTPSLSGDSAATLTDIDGDGKTDVLWTRNNTRSVWLSNGNGTFQILSVGTSIGDDAAGLGGYYYRRTGGLRYPFGTDFNSDGKGDFFWSIVVAPTQGPDPPPPERIYTQWQGIKTQTAATITFYTTSFFAGNGTGLCPHDPPPDCGTVTFYYTAFNLAADFNGDSQQDLLWIGGSNGTRVIWTSTGAKLADGSVVNVSQLLGVNAGKFVVNTNNANSTPSGYGPTIADFNGDGKSDILWFRESGHLRMLWLSKGDGTFHSPPSFTNVAGQDGINHGNTVLVADFNGDGKSDLLWDQQDGSGRSNGTRKLWLSQGMGTDLLAKVTSGLGAVTNVTYQPLSRAGAPYTKGTGAVYPIVDAQGPMWVVTSVAAPNGIGGTYLTNFSYAGAKIDLSGRGFLGFQTVTVTDPQTTVQQITTYRQDYPFIGLASQSVSQITTPQGLRTLNQTTSSYAATNLGGTRRLPYLHQQVEASWDLDGSVIPAVTSSYQYDAYGNPTQVVVSMPDGASQTTVNSYTNDTTNWFLGRLTASTVTSVVP